LIKGILFDLDGVIVDTLHYHWLAWNRVFQERGGEVNKLTVLLHEGRTSKEFLPILMKEAGVHIPEPEREKIIEEKRRYYRSIAKIKLYPGALDTIKELKKLGIKCALVTGSAKKNMEKALTKEEQGLFDLIVTADDTSKGKPNPIPYNIAREKLGLKRKECLVVENSPLGIQSAKKAGIRCVAVTTTLSKEQLLEACANCRGADFYISNLRELPELIKKLQ
jgi:beta-phosphoglucomutase